MSTLGKAVITFAADTATFIGDVGKAVAQFERSMGRMQAAVRGLDGPLARLTAGLSIAGMGLFVKNVIDTADETGKLSQKLGINTEKVSELQLAYQLGDGAQEGFKKGLVAFNQSLVEASNTSSKAARIFKALGVDVTAGPAEAFRQFAEQMSQLPDGELKTAAAMEILKKAGADWIPVLNGGSKGLADSAEKARALGLVISDDFARSASQFNDNMKLIQKSSIGFANAILAGGVIGVLDDIAKRLEKGAEEGRKFGAALDIARRVDAQIGANLNPNDPLFQRKLEQFHAEDALGSRGPLHMGQISIGKIRRDSPAAAANETANGPDPEALRKALAENEAEIKRYVSALRTLEHQLSGLNDMTAEEATNVEVFGRNMTLSDGTVVHLEGSLEKLTAAHKVNLLNLSLEITRRQNLIRLSEMAMPSLQAEIAAVEAAGENYRQFSQMGAEANRELEFQTKLLLLSAREQEKANALHQIDIELRRRQAELARTAGEDTALFGRENAKLEAEAQRQRENAIKGIQGRQRVERDWATGSKQAFDEYLDHATNAAEQARMLFGNAFRNMEDALVQFVKTGKLDFKSLADSIITDMIRIMVQRQIMGPILQGMGMGGGIPTGIGGGSGGIFGALGSLFGGGSGAGVVGDTDFIEAAVAFAAKGGIVGAGGVMPLRAYARGGVATGPQMAVFGEGAMNEAYVPLPDGRRIPVNLQGGKGANGDTYIIDAKGADRAGLERLEAMIEGLDGSIEHRALAITANARGRGGAYSARMRGRH